MSALSKIKDPQKFFYALLHQKDPVTLSDLLENAIEAQFTDIETFTNALNGLLSTYNLAAYRQNRERLKEIPPEATESWIRAGYIPADYFPLVAAMLGKEDDKCFAVCHSPEGRGTYLDAMVNRRYIAYKGDYADFFAYAAAMQNISGSQLARKMGLYQSQVDAIADGKLHLSTASLARVSEVLLKKFVVANAHPALIEALEKSAEGERKLYRQMRGEQAAFIAGVLGDINLDTTPDSIRVKLLESPEASALSKKHDKNIPPVEIKDAAHLKIFNDVAQQNKPANSFEEELSRYLKVNGTPRNRTAQDFLAKFKKEHKLSQESLYHRWHVTPKAQVALGGDGRPSVIESILQHEGVDNPERRLQVYALFRGRQPYLSIDEICAQAEEILNKSYTPEHMPPDIGANNRVYEKMLERGFTPKEGPIDTTKISCSICEVLCEQSGLNTTQLSERGGYDQGITLPNIHNGKHTVTLLTTKTGTEERVDNALRMAKTFTEDAKRQGRLGLLLQGLTQKEKPEEWLKQIKAKTLTPGQAIRRYRRQNFISPKIFAATVKEKGFSGTWEALNNIEIHNTLLRARGPEAADRDAGILAAEIGYIPGTEAFDEYKKLLQGRALATVTKKELEKMVEDAMSPDSKLSLRDFLQPIADLKGARSDGDFCKMVKLPENAHLEGMTLKRWKSGTHPRSNEKYLAEALADCAGFASQTRENFIQICMDKVMRYDPKLVAEISESSTREERSDTLKTLRDNAKLTNEELSYKIHEKMRIRGFTAYGSKDTCRIFQVDGGVLRDKNPDSASRNAAFVQSYIASIVPDIRQADQQKLERVLNSPIPSIGAGEGHAAKHARKGPRHGYVVG